MMNFDTNNLIIVVFPINAGGRFLVNCLGVSDNAVFQDRILAQRQMDLDFGPQDKFNFLKNEINNVTKEEGWNDLNLSDGALFGFANKDYLLSPELVQKYAPFTEISCIVNDANKKFFITAHWPLQLPCYLSAWPNAIIIVLENFNNFISFRTNKPMIPETRLTTYRIEQEKSHREQILQITSHITNPIYKWNCDWYFDEEQTIQGLRYLYQELKFSDFDENLLRRYHNLWFNKLSELAPEQYKSREKGK